MAPSKKYLPEYLSFTRKERIGIITIAVLIVLFIILPFLFPFFIIPKQTDHTDFEKEITALQIRTDSSKLSRKNYSDEDRAYDQPSQNYYSREIKEELFYFDPNSLSVAGWVKLGVREKTANSIHNYVAKGGRFYKPQDIAKIWGLHPGDVSRLLPYVRIAAQTATDQHSSKTFEPGKLYEKQKYVVVPVDINTADTSAFVALPGIGSKLAGRIIAFREKLGGFYKIEQLAETYALADSVFQKIKDKLLIGNSRVKQININDATLEELKTHPYIRFAIANAIVQYKNQHGAFTAVTDLKKIMAITDELYNKMVPYISIK